jgi:O-antigen ligase
VTITLPVARPDIAPATRRPPGVVMMLLLLVPASLPYALVLVLGGPIPLRLIALAALATTAGIVAHRLSCGLVPLRVPPVAWGFVGLACLGLASSAAAPDPGAALRALSLPVIGLLLALALGSAGIPRHWLRWTAGSLLAAGVVVCVRGIAAAGTPQTSFDGTYVANRAQGDFAQPNDFGSFCAAVFVLGVGLAFAARTWWSRLAFAVGAVVGGTGLVLSLSRGALLGGAVGLAVLPILLPELRRYFLLGTLLLAPVLVLVLSTASPGSGTGVIASRLATIGSGEVSPLDERSAIWVEGRRQALAFPLLGVGPGGYPDAAVRTPDRVLRLVPAEGPAGAATAVGPDHAHNVLLTTAAEVGLVAALLQAFVTARLAWLARRAAQAARQPSHRYVVAGLAGSLATFLMQGTVDYVLRNPLLLLLLWFLVGLLLAALADSDAHAA